MSASASPDSPSRPRTEEALHKSIQDLSAHADQARATHACLIGGRHIPVRMETPINQSFPEPRAARPRSSRTLRNARPLGSIQPGRTGKPEPVNSRDARRASSRTSDVNMHDASHQRSPPKDAECDRQNGQKNRSQSASGPGLLRHTQFLPALSQLGLPCTESLFSSADGALSGSNPCFPCGKALSGIREIPATAEHI